MMSASSRDRCNLSRPHLGLHSCVAHFACRKNLVGDGYCWHPPLRGIGALSETRRERTWRVGGDVPRWSVFQGCAPEGWCAGIRGGALLGGARRGPSNRTRQPPETTETHQTLQSLRQGQAAEGARHQELALFRREALVSLGAAVPPPPREVQGRGRSSRQSVPPPPETKALSFASKESKYDPNAANPAAAS